MKKSRKVFVPTAASMLGVLVKTRKLEETERREQLLTRCHAHLEAREESLAQLPGYASVVDGFLQHEQRAELEELACMLYWAAHTWTFDNRDARLVKSRLVPDLTDFLHNALVVMYCNTVGVELETHRAAFSRLSAIQLPGYGVQTLPFGTPLQIKDRTHHHYLKKQLSEILPVLFPVVWELDAVRQKLTSRRYRTGKLIPVRRPKPYIPPHADSKLARKAGFKFGPPS